MGFIKVVQYGNVTEIYQYEKDIVNHRRKHESKIARKRRQARRLLKTNSRSKFSINRAKREFFRLCHHNNTHNDTVTFVTLTLAYDTDYSTALVYLRRFFDKLKKLYDTKQSPLSYISVTELTKKGRYHFHLLVYNLPPEVSNNERATRNIQICCWQRGFLSFSFATYKTRGIAGYMAKYMGKFLADFRNEARRAYSCSRNIKKVSSFGDNSLTVDDYIDFGYIKPLSDLPEKKSQYTVPFLGNCVNTKYIR